ncbi:MAG: hypothetical protein A2486_12695 [Burkholderiales bacterium RIFOXYC12_FULL_65_23]|nr:MAG: hypothetical protein A2486_12695 [Burkholderiales bacterium RIFOXYC12_FULL_65_23]
MLLASRIRNQAVGDVVVVVVLGNLLPDVPVRAARIERVHQDVLACAVEGLGEFSGRVVHDHALALCPDLLHQREELLGLAGALGAGQQRVQGFRLQAHRHAGDLVGAGFLALAHQHGELRAGDQLGATQLAVLHLGAAVAPPVERDQEDKSGRAQDPEQAAVAQFSPAFLRQRLGQAGHLFNLQQAQLTLNMQLHLAGRHAQHIAGAREHISLERVLLGSRGRVPEIARCDREPDQH